MFVCKSQPTLNLLTCFYQLHDVRASQIQDRSLTIGQYIRILGQKKNLAINFNVGMQNKALHIFDLDNPRPVRSFITHSDVFALHRDIVRHVFFGTLCQYQTPIFPQPPIRTTYGQVHEMVPYDCLICGQAKTRSC